METCPICFDDMTKSDTIVALDCNPYYTHRFHVDCINAWITIEKEPKFPTCGDKFHIEKVKLVN